MSVKGCSVIGLGKLGACMAAAIASKGFKVIGVDKDLRRVAAINRKHAPVFEPGLEKMLVKNGSHIFATTDYKNAVLNSDVTFIVVPTPSKPNGNFSLKYVNQAVEKIALALAQKPAYHIIVVTSTVLPASIDTYVRPALERYSGKKCGRDFGLCYNPEFIALGTVIKNFLNPDFILIGESDRKAGRALADFFSKVCNNNPAIARMNFVNAELTKISVNSFITTKITFANMLSELAQRLPRGDVDIVTAAMGFDSRIGKRYLKGGLGYGGPCFPRDNSALSLVARKLRVRADIPESTDTFNRRIIPRLFKLIRLKLKPGLSVGILGLSYKPSTNVIEESQGFLLAKRLIKAGVRPVLYDSLAMDSVRSVLGDKAKYARSANDLVKCSQIIVIANPDSKFSGLHYASLASDKRSCLIIDCWRILRGKISSLGNGIEYIAFGIGK